VDLALPLAGCSRRLLHEQAAALVEAECARIQAAHALLAGRLVQEGAALADALAGAAAGSAAGAPLQRLQLLAWPACQAAPPAAEQLAGQCQQQQAVGSCRLQGAITGVVVAHSRQPAARAAQDLRSDLQASLRTRLDLLLQEAEQLQGAQQQEAGQQQQPGGGHPLLVAAGSKLYAGPLPRRVLLPWQGALRLSDHLLPGEAEEECLERARDMLALGARECGKVGARCWALPRAQRSHRQRNDLTCENDSCRCWRARRQQKAAARRSC
jgi:hypothetical protein